MENGSALWTATINKQKIEYEIRYARLSGGVCVVHIRMYLIESRIRELTAEKQETSKPMNMMCVLKYYQTTEDTHVNSFIHFVLRLWSNNISIRSSFLKIEDKKTTIHILFTSL